MAEKVKKEKAASPVTKEEQVKKAEEAPVEKIIETKPVKEKVKTKTEEKSSEDSKEKKESPKAADVKAETKKESKKEDKKGEKVDIVSETVYIIPLRKVYHTKPCYRRTNKAVATLVTFICRHTKATEENVKISSELNQHIWAHGNERPPRKVQVKAVKDSTGKVTVSLLK